MDQYEYIVISIAINIVLYIQRFMRHVKKVNPEKRCFLQYDKLYIDGKVFMFNETTGKVTTETMATKMLMQYNGEVIMKGREGITTEK